MSIVRKLVSLLLVIGLVFSCVVFPASFTAPEGMCIDEYEFTVLENNIERTIIQYINDDTGTICIFELDKQNGEGKAEINVSGEVFDSSMRSISLENHVILLDDDIEYGMNEEITMSGVEMVDVNSGEIYDLGVEPGSRAAFAIPYGIPLITKAIEALLLVGSAVIIAGVAWTMAESIANELTRQTQYRYWNAKIINGAVYLGGGLSSLAAKSLAFCDDSKGTVMAQTGSYARGILGNLYDGPEIDSLGGGYWPHYHVKKNNSTRYKAHVWYFNP